MNLLCGRVEYYSLGVAIKCVERDSKLFHENQDADYKKGSNNLDGDELRTTGACDVVKMR